MYLWMTLSLSSALSNDGGPPVGFSEDIQVRRHSQTTHTPDKLRMIDIGTPVRPLRDSKMVKSVDLINSDCIFVLFICSFSLLGVCASGCKTLSWGIPV